MKRVVPGVELALYIGGAVPPPVGPEAGLCIQGGPVRNDVEVEVVVVLVVGKEIRAIRRDCRCGIWVVHGAENDCVVLVRLGVIQQTLVTTKNGLSLVLQHFAEETIWIPLSSFVAARQVRNP